MNNIIVGLLIILLCGCAHLNVQTPQWSLNANTFCKDIQIPKITVTTPGSAINVEGYHSTVNAAAFESIVAKVMEDVIAMGIKAWVTK
jgi:hypothetical protein